MTVTLPLPVELQGVGRVKGRFILVSPDTINDPDVYPEARASSGTVTFTPATKLSKTTNYAAVVGHPAKTFPVDSYGVLQDEELSGGVWLREDTYLVSYNLQGMTIDPHSIVVTSAYTDESPLVLSAVISEDLPTGTTITMLEVPLGASQGQFLGWDNEAGLVWQATAVPDASTTTKGVVELATPEETVTGEDAVRATTPAGVKAALDAKTLSDMSTYVAQADLAVTAGASVEGSNTGDQDLSGLLTTAAAPELIRDTMGTALVAGDNVTITPDDGADTITIAASRGGSSLGLWLPGVAANYVSAPYAADHQTIDLDVRARIRMADYSVSGQQCIACRYQTSTSTDQSWLFMVFMTNSDQSLQLKWHNGTAETQLPATVMGGNPLTNGTAAWVRATLDVDNGAGGYEIKFYYAADSDDEPSSWTQWGSTVTGATTTTIQATTAALDIGVARRAALPFTGTISRVVLKGSIGGASVADWKAVNTRYRDPQGNVWIVNGTANAFEEM